MMSQCFCTVTRRGFGMSMLGVPQDPYLAHVFSGFCLRLEFGFQCPMQTESTEKPSSCNKCLDLKR